MNEMLFLSKINRYFNYGYTGKEGKLAAFLHPAIPMRVNAANIQSLYHNFQVKNDLKNTKQFQLPAYNGKQKIVTEIADVLRTNLRNEIANVIVHGSVATNETIPYSDFDGLIILNNEAFSDTDKIYKIAKHLNRTYKMMLTFDRFQHHGWLVLCEKNLENWPCSVFPPEILNHCSSLPGFSTQLNIKFDESYHYTKNNLLKHCNNIIQKLTNKGLPHHPFTIKSLLSEFMLIPSLYVQTKTGKGVFKKFSFGFACADFSVNDWKVMNDISEIRNQWPEFSCTQTKNGYFTPFTRYRQINDNSKLPDNITRQLNDDLKNRMIHLTTLFIDKINGTEVH